MKEPQHLYLHPHVCKFCVRWTVVTLAVLFLTLLPQGVALGQEKQTIQIKTFDQKLQPLKNIEVSLNGKEYVSVGHKGFAIAEINSSDLPIKSVTIKDDKLEAASWDFSKGIIEIIVRPKSYTLVHFVVQFPDGTRVPRSTVSFKGSKTVTAETNATGEVDIPIVLNEKITGPGQFQINNLQVSSVNLSSKGNVITVTRPRVLSAEEKKKAEAGSLKGQLSDFDMTKLDSIQSITVFYAVFKDIAMKDLTAAERKKLDAKFHELVMQMEDSVARSQSQFIANISDSSFVAEDIRNLLNHATLESDALQANRSEFDAKVQVISSKLEKGIANFTDEERKSLLADIDLLEKILIQNESKFYQNRSDYQEIINTLKQKYFDIQNLETRLSDSEKQRNEEQRISRQRFIVISSVLIVFGALIILLWSFSSRLRKQAKDLKAANEEIKTMNENLEAIVEKRTQLLEESNRELDTFLYRASHDLRSPVRSILGLCNIIDHIPPTELSHRMRGTTLSMDRMLKKLINISEISQHSAAMQKINVSSAIAEAKSKLAEMIKERGVQLHINCAEDITLNSSSALIENILINLIENAVFFSALKNQDDARVEIKASVNGSTLELSVFDNGVGIEDSIRPKLFHMFFTGHEKTRGNGLGLYAVHKCVTALYGKITVDSKAGQYAKISVTLPYN